MAGGIVKIDIEQMEQILTTTEQAGSDVRETLKKLRTPFTALVPDKWEGEAASKFKGDMDVLLSAMDKLQETLDKTPDVIKRMMTKLADGHKQGQAEVRKAGQSFVGAGAQTGP
jgi:WXG100 family type VII secretion target